MSNSKKFSRSKKTDGSNVPNFVFNFGGSQPGSPLASPGSFASNSTPASPAATGFNFGANTSQPFVFGDPAASATVKTPALTTSTSFNFNSSPTTNHPFNTKRGQSELDLNVPEREVLRRATSDMTFSIPNSTNTGFSFTPSTPVKSTLASQPSFGSTGSQSSLSFAAPPIQTSTPTTSGISFSSPAASSTSTSNISADTGFSFGSSDKTPVAKPFTFGAPATSTTTTTPTTAPSFGFGASTASAPTTAPSFGFGTASTSTAIPTTTISTSTPSATTTPTTSFTFGATTPAPSASTEKPAVSLSAASTPAAVNTTPAMTGFTFGKPADSANTTPSTATSTTTTAASSPFTITAPIATTKPLTDTATKSTSSTGTKTGFSFGAPTEADKTFAANPSTNFNFGTTLMSKPSSTTTSSTSTSTATTTTTTTTTATSTAASATAPTSSLFSLGTLTGDKDGKKSDSSTTPFSFGANLLPTTKPTVAVVDPAKPNAFSFSKILEDLAQTAAQPANQMYASLITPGLAALQQNHVVSHTNFRIDNILSTTRFTELPEQAQKELDELEKYIRLEGQRCDYIGNYKVPQHLNAMDKAKKSTESLSQQLDALSSTLKGQVESIASLYENVKTQLRHANEGCAVIEACKHPGNNARWLFGYSEYDNYFSLLAKQLGGRLEEYQKCIWEIERTAESWSHNRVQSPKDIADIMRAQNQAFLALSNKVAALHESVNVELNYYNQYLKMYS